MTSAVDLTVVAWRALDPAERETAYRAITELRLRDLAGEESEGSQYVAALRLVADHLGRSPSPLDYDEARRVLQAQGHELPPRSRLVKHFRSWRLAKEALDLSEVTTVRRIEARFASRKLGKVWKYTDASLAETMGRCASELGRPPRVAEFVHWREREMQLAKARGEDAHIPSPNAYRKRWRYWDAGLLALGYSEAAVAERLDETRSPTRPVTRSPTSSVASPS